MKLLIISSVDYNQRGIGCVIKNLYDNSLYKNDEITFIVPKTSNVQMVEELRKLNYRVILDDCRNQNPLKYMVFLLEIMKKEKFNLVHIHGNSATNTIELFPAFICRIPVRIMHGHAASSRHMIIHKTLRILMNALCTQRFSCSEKAGKFLFGDIKNVYIIKNAFNISNYQFREDIRKKYRECYDLEDKFVIGHVGGFCIEKNHEFLVKIFKKITTIDSSARLLLIGDGPLYPKIKQLVVDLEIKDKVLFLGEINNVKEILNSMDIFVFPSINEGLGIAPIEAQVNGLRVIAAKEGVSEEIKITDNVVFLELEAGEDAWVDKILKNRSRINDNNESIKDKGYNIEDESVRLYELYTKLIKLQ